MDIFCNKILILKYGRWHLENIEFSSLLLLLFPRGSQSEYLAKHIGLFHMHMDEFMYKEEMVAAKRKEYIDRMQEIKAEKVCEICDKTMPKPK